MSSDRIRRDELDDFWDISKLVPNKSCAYSRAPSASLSQTETVVNNKTDEKESDSVIRRYVTDDAHSLKLNNERKYESVETYTPADSLIHSVNVCKLECKYKYYDTFLKDAERYFYEEGSECPYIPFFSYMPQYDQMNKDQLSYYLYFRSSITRGSFIKTDYGYLFLYIYELINYTAVVDKARAQWMLTELWNRYRKEYPMINTKLALWICDFSLVHKLSPPENARQEMIRSTLSLGEFYIKMPKDDMTASARTLMKYCSSYDYRTSKFATGENESLFDTHILGGVAAALCNSNEILERLGVSSSEDSRVEREAFAGALCAYSQRYRLEVRYCSFSRSNELRFLIGDIVKYCENKIRAHIGVKSKMTIYSVSVDMKKILDTYFSENLTEARRKRATAVKQEYEVLYDVPKKKLSLSDAKRIEEESWMTTEELVSAFEEEETAESVEATVPVEESKAESVEDPFFEYRDIIKATMSDPSAFSSIAREMGIMSEALLDKINEIAFDVIGDSVIEDDGMGGYSIIEDYRYLFE